MKKTFSLMMEVFNRVYQTILLNLYFLILNIFFFQIYFVINFEPSFFIVYFLASITFVPTMIILLKNTRNEVSSTFFRILIELKECIKATFWTMILIPFLFFLSITNLYLLSNNSFMSIVLLFLNVVSIVLQLILVVNILRNSMNGCFETLLKRSFKNYVLYLPQNFMILVMNLLMLLIAFKVSYVSIIFIFGLLVQVNKLFFEKENDKELKFIN